jgi:hypothetical protein
MIKFNTGCAPSLPALLADAPPVGTSTSVIAFFRVSTLSFA